MEGTEKTTSPVDGTTGTTGTTGASDTADQGKQSDGGINYEIAFKEKNAKLKETVSALAERDAKLADYELKLKTANDATLAEQGKYKELFEQESQAKKELEFKFADYEKKDAFVKSFVSQRLEEFKKEVGEEKYTVASNLLGFETTLSFELLSKIDEMKKLFGGKTTTGGSAMPASSTTTEKARYDELMSKVREKKTMTNAENKELSTLAYALRK